MASVGFRDVTKVFDDRVVALDHLDLDIGHGELFAIVGASGCGKSTALRVLAGLDEATGGTVLIDDRDVTDVPTRSRNVGIVTQGDTLLEHRTSRRNIRLPLEHRRGSTRPDTADEIVTVQARELAIARLLERRPSQLSRGERRAVQLARAVVAHPDVLLLDEPLAFMDQVLRRRMRHDIVGIQRRHNVTTVLVTADQEDAIAMSSRVAMLVEGRLHQIGPPADLLERPATTQVAGFFGEPAMNLVSVPVRLDRGERRVRIFGHDLHAWSPLLDVYSGREVIVGIRPADLVESNTGHETVAARVESVAPYGHRTDFAVTTVGGLALAVSGEAPGPRVGERVRLAIRPDRFHWFDPATGMAILHPASR